MKAKAISYFLFTSLALACSDKNNCFVAETIVPVNKIDVSGVDHFLYLRSSGFHEKEHFYELYENAPKFDECGKTNVIPLSVVHVDNSKGAVVRLVVDNSKLTVVYSKDKPQGTDVSGVAIDVK